MKNIVTFKTAADLKVAGFPQPDPEEGQFWYRPSGGIGYIDMVDNDGDIYVLLNGEVKGVKNFDSAIFAPTATDILAEMKAIDPNLVCTRRPANGGSTFICYANDRHFADENPAEAAALAYIEVKKK